MNASGLASINFNRQRARGYHDRLPTTTTGGLPMEMQANKTAKKLPAFIRNDIAQRIKIHRKVTRQFSDDRDRWERRWETIKLHSALIDGAFLSQCYYKAQIEIYYQRAEN
jgi:hypothetical protein